MSVDQFSVATFNLYNFQLPDRRMNPGQKVWTAEEFRRKVAWVTRQLLSVDADIVGLQELWHRDAIAEVLTDPQLADTYELLAEPADGNGIICAALVRRGLRSGDPEWVSDFPDIVKLQSSDPGDPQAPRISVSVPRFSRPVLHLGWRCATTPR